ncbi:MAG: hypothetical protein M3Z66_07005, partial [Chloroflexota bacterium]|nr:hypothetical protein [Chloroflexota bacterium]
ATLWNATNALRTIARLPFPPVDRIRRETLVQALEEQVSAGLLSAASGASMTLDQAVDFCLEDERNSPASATSLSIHR